jgi:hypothetical protein
MSTVAEIKEVLPNLSTEQLREVEHAVRNLYRERHVDIIYDDAYGVWTEEDQASAAAEAFVLMDNQEGNRGQGPSR